MGVVTETTFGASDLSEAVALERMEDGMIKQVRLQIEAAICAVREGRIGRALGSLQAALVELDQIDDLDQAEISVLTQDTPEHIYQARDEGREIIGLCGPARVVA